MPKYFCDYCDTYLTHDSPSVRKTHCGGRKHKENVKFYYQKWMEEQAQNLIDATTAAYKVCDDAIAFILRLINNALFFFRPARFLRAASPSRPRACGLRWAAPLRT